MPLYHCDKCHHEFEGSKEELKCDWCGASAHIIKEKTELEIFLESMKNERRILSER